jgi:carbamoyl-phosphate synthase small subunit
MTERTYLVLENGSIYDGRGFGFPPPLPRELRPGIPGFTNAGEVVFNTAMVGYHEVLTDPSYTGQIVSMTYPHMGNYGHLDEWNESGPIRAADGGAAATTCDTRPIKVAGFVLRSLYRGPVPAGRITLDDYLRRHEIPGITEVDTRRLTLELRDHGSGNGVLVRPENPVLGLSPEELEAIESVPRRLSENGGPQSCFRGGEPGNHQPDRRRRPLPGRVAWHSMIAAPRPTSSGNLKSSAARLPSTPPAALPADILSGGHHAVMLSNGPGDPEVLKEQISTVKGLIGNIPVFGICLGHQLIAEALGATTYKMKFGHHGINHPVRDERTKKVFVTSQNHGFAVEEDSLPNGTEVWFRNANDGSVEGLRNDGLKKVLSAQFHPESAPGPYDSHWIFEEFLKAIGPVGAEISGEQGA